MVCETDDTIYLIMVDDCDESSSLFNMLKELALAITSAHLTATPDDINRMVTERAKEAIRNGKLYTTDKQPTSDSKTVSFDDILKPMNIGTVSPKATPSSNIRALAAPMFKKF
jgi:hypothetical protein